VNLSGSTTGRPAAAAEGLADLARTVTSRLAPHPERRNELLGEAFLVCESLRREHPKDFADAAAKGRLAEWCLPRVRAALRSGDPNAETSIRTRGGWMGTFMGPDGRDCGADEDYSGTDGEALRTGQRALARALSRAKEEGNATLLRNLRWYRQRLEHKSYEAIARSEGRVPATVRTGVARARKYVLRIVHELQHTQPAPLTADAPPELEPLRQLWVDQELPALERELERTREEYGDDPHWLNLLALVTADRGRRAEAKAFYERALLVADAAPIRARLLNNLANVVDDEGAAEEAQIYWMRAHQLAPQSAAPLLNLLAAASSRRDYPSAQHFTARIGELLSSGRMSSQERSYACRRLRENPKLDWLRDTEVWRLGPARWIRASEEPGRKTSLRAIARAAVAVAMLGLAILPSSAALAASLSGAATHVRETAPTTERGGDSMGTPVGRGGGSKGS